MRKLKITINYLESTELVKKTLIIPVPSDKEEEAFNFEGLLASKDVELSMSIINSNVSVLTWKDDEGVPTERMSIMAAEVDSDLLVATSPRLQDNPENIMVFCPPSMELFVRDGGFAAAFNDIRDDYESLHWTGHGDEWDLIVYFKDGRTLRHRWPLK